MGQVSLKAGKASAFPAPEPTAWCRCLSRGHLLPLVPACPCTPLESQNLPLTGARSPLFTKPPPSPGWLLCGEGSAEQGCKRGLCPLTRHQATSVAGPLCPLLLSSALDHSVFPETQRPGFGTFCQPLKSFKIWPQVHMWIFPKYFHSYQQILKQQILCEVRRNVSRPFKSIFQSSEPHTTDGILFKRQIPGLQLGTGSPRWAPPANLLFHQVREIPDPQGAGTEPW